MAAANGGGDTLVGGSTVYLLVRISYSAVTSVTVAAVRSL
jgi:uncharacterized MAPEG superfamily protein